jgi:hypothetical protein
VSFCVRYRPTSSVSAGVSEPSRAPPPGPTLALNFPHSLGPALRLPAPSGPFSAFFGRLARNPVVSRAEGPLAPGRRISWAPSHTNGPRRNRCGPHGLRMGRNPFQRRVEQLQHLSFGEPYLHPTLTRHGTRRRRHIRLLVSSVSWTSALGSPSTASLARPHPSPELHRFTSIFAIGQRLGPEIARCEPIALAGLAGPRRVFCA